MTGLFKISLVKSSQANQNISNSESIVKDLRVLFAELPPLESIVRWHNSDPDHLFSQNQQIRKTAESFHTLAKSHSRNAILIDLQKFFARAGDDPSTIFPTAKEITDELLPATTPLRTEFPFHTTNLNFSHPVCAADTTSLNVIVRLYNHAKENLIKIKIGAFVDRSDRIFWEVGFVDATKSTRNIRRMTGFSHRSKADYFLLQKLVDCTKTFIMRRDRVKGLDLTPAYYHVVQLCRRLGGHTLTEFDWAGWNRDIDEAFAHSIQLAETQRAGLTAHEQETIHRRYLISWLFDQGLLKDPTGRVLKWQPPRLVWFP
jgi:hypothetical protein